MKASLRAEVSDTSSVGHRLKSLLVAGKCIPMSVSASQRTPRNDTASVAYISWHSVSCRSPCWTFGSW